MNSRFLFIMLFMACFVMNASAQFSNSGSSKAAISDNSDWSTIYVEWNPSNANIPKNNDFFWDNKVDGKFNGYSLGYSRSISLTPSIPIFLELGLTGQFLHKSWINSDDGQFKISAISVKIPINALYKIDIPNSPVSLIPFAGINVRVNVWGQGKWTEEYDDNDDTDESSFTFNVFDKTEMEWLDYKNSTGKRVQVGWQVGLKGRFAKKIIIGGSYGSDFNAIFKDLKVHTVTILLGYSF